MGIIQCVIYIVCLNIAGARPVTDSSSWMDLIFLTGNKEAVQTEVGQEQEPSSGAPLLHSEFCGTRPGFSDSGRRIVGGSLARAGEVPWQASLARTEAEGSGLTPVCGAAVVSARAVLTAAHCLKLPVSSYRILVGRTSLLTPECGAQVMEVKGYNLHPAFSPRTLDNDLAVVEVVTMWGQGMQFSTATLPACLPPGPRPHLYSPGTVGLVSGFGVLSENATSLSDSLQTVSLPVMDLVRCEESYRKITNIGPSQFCAGFEDRTFIRDACSGDSGGPLAVLEGDRWFLTGLVSFGLGCGRTKYPGVYTRLDVMSIWIMDRLREIEGVSHPTTTTTSSTTPAPREPQVVYKVSALCPGSVKYIWCKFGREIKMLEAQYGRRAADTGTCQNNQIYPNTEDCSLGTVFTELSSTCDGQRTCRVSTEIFSDNPCQSTEPYLRFKFYCHNPLERSFEINIDEFDVIEFP